MGIYLTMIYWRSIILWSSIGIYPLSLFPGSSNKPLSFARNSFLLKEAKESGWWWRKLHLWRSEIGKPKNKFFSNYLEQQPKKSSQTYWLNGAESPKRPKTTSLLFCYDLFYRSLDSNIRQRNLCQNSLLIPIQFGVLSAILWHLVCYFSFV